ncbi:MAG: hypothetical protein ACJAUC_004430, partial [Planctomycetota bacterium]
GAPPEVLETGGNSVNARLVGSSIATRIAMQTTTKYHWSAGSCGWRALTTIAAVLLAVVILGVLQLKYSQPQELH